MANLRSTSLLLATAGGLPQYVSQAVASLYSLSLLRYVHVPPTSKVANRNSCTYWVANPDECSSSSIAASVWAYSLGGEPHFCCASWVLNPDECSGSLNGSLYNGLLSGRRMLPSAMLPGSQTLLVFSMFLRAFHECSQDRVSRLPPR